MVEAQSPMEGCVIVRDIEYGSSGDSDHMNCSEDDIAGPSDGTVDGQAVTCGGEAWPVVCTINMVNRGAQILFFLMMGLVAGLVILGGFFILTGGGSEENIAKGKKYITYAIIGVFIGVFAYAVPAILSFIM